MSRRGTRKRIARGIYDDRIGRSAIYRDAAGRQREVRFPPFTPVADIRQEIDRRQKQQRRGADKAAARGTLDAAIQAWTPLEQHLASWRERRAELRAWAALYGDRQLRLITAHDVRAAISQWATDGVSPKTIRNRLWTLRHLYHVILGHDAESPVDHVAPPAKVRQVITPVSAETVLAVYQRLLDFEQDGTLRDAKTRARFMVRAASGRRPIEIMRAKPEDVDLERRIWRVRDAKGGWSEGLYLHDDLLAAWRLYVDADAWGMWDTGSMARVLRRAGWPSSVRPYNLRHSVGIHLSEIGVDLADVAGYLGHKDVRTTRESYVPVLGSRMERVGGLLNGRLKGWTVPASVPALPRGRACKSVEIKGRPAPRSRGKKRR